VLKEDFVKALQRPSLLWRLFLSYLLVIALGSVTLFFASEMAAPILLEHHMRDMQAMDNPPTTALLTDMDEELKELYRRAMNQALLWGIVASALVAIGVSWWVTRQIIAPVKKLEQASRRIAEGRYQERLDTKAPGEIGELADSFNEMAGALESVELKRAELIGNVAHEFRTPLSGLRGYIEGYKDKVFDPDDATLDACLKQLSRLEHLIDDLSLLSRVQAGVESLSPQPVTAYQLLEQIKASFTPSFANKGVDLQIVKNLREDVQVFADPHRTLQILSNLVSNALRYTPIGGRVALWLDMAEDKLVFHVQDTGQGISEEDLPHVFTRFFRADKARSERGSGIGLTIARYFVEAQKGEIKVESKVGEGSHFYFSLPLVPYTIAQTESHLMLESPLRSDPYGQKL
jgi:signal transduction histidine kinase